MRGAPAFELPLRISCLETSSADGAAPILKALRDRGLADPALRRFPCLGGCTRRGRLSIVADGRWSWLLGGMDAPAQAGAFAEFVALWLAAPEGLVRKADRPSALKDNVTGRLPPRGATP